MADNRKTVMIIRTMPAAGKAVLAARNDVRLVEFAYDVSRADLITTMKAEARVDAMVLGQQQVGPGEIAAAQGLQVVARMGVGYDAIDVPALTAAGIPLMTTGTANSPSVAEKAMYFMLALAKRGPAMDQIVKTERWLDRLGNMPLDLYGKTVLVVGFGRIGTRMVKRCLAMEMAVLVSDPHVDPAVIRAAGAEPVQSLAAALGRADFVTLHCPKTVETTNLVSAREFALMKPSAYLINTARGGVVDEVALHDALQRRVIAGAGIDVLAEEPPKTRPLLADAPNILLAPHMAGVTKESFDRMAIQAAENLLSVFDGRTEWANVVNSLVLPRTTT